jgi:hypothetical protein
MSDISQPVIDRVLELAPAQLLTVDGFTYIDKDKSARMHVPPAPSALQIGTLTGFVDLLESGFESNLMAPSNVLIHVVDEDTVSLVSIQSDKFGRRQTFINANWVKPERNFQFNQFIKQEEFNIALQSLFVPDANITELLAISGNLTASNTSKQEDDGITQRVVVKAGIVKLDEVTPKPRVTLAPYRTFSEVVQPTSDYIFRVRQSEQGNTCALFDADGGFWKNRAVASVSEWLSNKLKGSTVDGLPDIRIIA